MLVFHTLALNNSNGLANFGDFLLWFVEFSVGKADYTSGIRRISRRSMAMIKRRISKEAASLFADLEKFSLNFWFVIRVNLLHP